MKRYDFEQRGAEWQRARLGIPTSSEFHRIIQPKSGELSKQAGPYMHLLLAEWMLGAPVIGYEGEAMYRGAEMEPEAVAAYELETGLQTEKVGFITDDAGQMGCSPDRLVADIGGCLEIKCPQSPAVHVGHMLERKLDDKHAPQTQGQLLLTGRAWVDTVSYYPGLPLVVIRTPRREDYISNLKAALDAFVETILKARESIVQRYGPFPIVRPPIDPGDHGSLGVSLADVEAIFNAARVRTPGDR